MSNRIHVLSCREDNQPKSILSVVTGTHDTGLYSVAVWTPVRMHTVSVKVDT